MRSRHGWLIALLTAALLAVACTREPATPTSTQGPGDADSPTAAPTEMSPTAAPEQKATLEPEEPAEPPVSVDDLHALGSPDAPLTIIEYSDFQ